MAGSTHLCAFLFANCIETGVALGKQTLLLCSMQKSEVCSLSLSWVEHWTYSVASKIWQQVHGNNCERHSFTLSLFFFSFHFLFFVSFTVSLSLFLPFTDQVAAGLRLMGKQSLWETPFLTLSHFCSFSLSRFHAFTLSHFQQVPGSQERKDRERLFLSFTLSLLSLFLSFSRSLFTLSHFHRASCSRLTVH